VDLGFRITRRDDFDVVVREPDTGRKLASATVTGVIGESVSEFTDPQGDDNGPGGYTYPTNGAFREEEGAFDLRTFTVFETDDSWRF
ncbi:hypothetical protein EXE43_27450, partial [Halorubrum sp. SS5]